MATDQAFTLQILHASDQEAGIPALQDAIGFSAVMNALEDDYENTIKLSSGDLFIAGPFFDASRDIYDSASEGGGAGQPGIADILIQNQLGWDAAAVGNHEFDAGDETFFNLLAPNSDIVNGVEGGQGIGDDGYSGAAFPYLSTNLDYSNAILPEGVSVVEGGGEPTPNTLTSSVVVDVNGEQIGVLGAVTPYLPTIAGIGDVTMLTGDDITATTAIEQQVEALVSNIAPEVESLTQAGVNKIILMTHLQESAIEQALAQALVDQGIEVDVLIGGGSHQVMANGTEVPPLREDETQQESGQLLQPYPQVFSSDESNIYYVNTGANYRYLGQLVAHFDDNGVITEVDEEVSNAYATDIAGVDRLYEEEIEDFEQVRDQANPAVVEIVDGLANFVNALDADIFGRSSVFLNGIRGDVRTQETNLGNLSARSQQYYAQEYLSAYGDDLLPDFDRIDLSIKNGGGIRDIIGQSFIEGGTNQLVQLPTQANPSAEKEEGDVSQLDISNSLRFNNDLTVGTVTAEGLYELAEHMVSGVEVISGRFGQIGGMRFSFDPNAQPRTEDQPGERIQNLALIDEDGSIREVIVENGELVVDPDQTYSVVTLSFLATGGDSYPDVITNQVSLSAFEEPETLGRSDLVSGGEQDALAEFLAAFHNEDEGQSAFREADTPPERDLNIQNLAFREDTVLQDNPAPTPGDRFKGDFNQDGISDLVWRERVTGDNGIWLMNDTRQGEAFEPSERVAIPSESTTAWAIAGTGDFNADGSEDILWRNFTNGFNGVWYMDGVERTSIADLAPEDNTAWYIGGVGDADQNGSPDLYWRNTSNGNNGIWFMDGTERLAAVSIEGESNPAWDLASVDDLNNDNIPDLIWRNGVTGANGIWLMGGDGGTEVQEKVAIRSDDNLEWRLRGSGDFNGDGNQDLIWRNDGTGSNGVWLMDGNLQVIAPVSFTNETNLAWTIGNR